MSLNIKHDRINISKQPYILTINKISKQPYILTINKKNEIIQYLMMLPDPIVLESIVLDNRNKKKCFTVMQRQIAITNPENQYTILSTFGLGPCHSIIMYNTTNKFGLLAHIDSMTSLNILNNVYKYLDINDINNVKIYISGGDGNHDLTYEIYLKLKMLNLHTRIIGTHLHANKKYSSISINTNDGKISNILCENFKTCPMPSFNPKDRQELELIYGFNSFLIHESNTWYNRESDTLLRNNRKAGQLVTIPSFSIETNEKTFENYVVKNESTNDIFSLSKKFTNTVIKQHPTDGPVGLFMFGSAGVGKTHLSVSIAKYVSMHGKKVIFIDSDYIKDYYQKMSGNPINFKEWIIGYDLIIVDDINNDYGITNNFIKEAFKYIYFFSKALLLTSNIEITTINGLFPIGYNKYGFLIKNIDAISYRQPWTNTIINIANTPESLIQKLYEYNGQQASGIILFDNNNRSILTKYGNLYAKNNANIKIRYAKEPMKSNHPTNESLFGKVHNLYMHNAHNYKVIIIKVFTNKEAEQLLHLIEKVHTFGLKIIVITQSFDFFRDLIIRNLKSRGMLNKKIKLFDRLRIIFPMIFVGNINMNGGSKNKYIIKDKRLGKYKHKDHTHRTKKTLNACTK